MIRRHWRYLIRRYRWSSPLAGAISFHLSKMLAGFILAANSLPILEIVGNNGLTSLNLWAINLRTSY